MVYNLLKAPTKIKSQQQHDLQDKVGKLLNNLEEKTWFESGQRNKTNEILESDRKIMTLRIRK